MSAYSSIYRQVALVINLRSRLGPSVSKGVHKELERHGVLVRESHLIKDGSSLVEIVRGTIERGATTVVVGGGDGTLSAVVDLFANRPDLTLGVLPIGTGNEVARVLGIPLSVAGACQVIAEGRVAKVDLAQANGNYFLHTALVGYPAHVNHSLPSWLKLPFGRAAYAYSLLVSILRARPFRVTLTAGGTKWKGQTVLAVVGNGFFHVPGSVLLPRSKKVRRGLLVYAPCDSRRLSLLRLAFALWVTRRKQPSLLFSAWSETASIVADAPQEVDLDGEFGLNTPVQFRYAPDALRVLVPDSLDAR